MRSEEHTSELQSQSNLVCRLLLEKKNDNRQPCTFHLPSKCSLFFFNDTATTEIYTLSLHDALPILSMRIGVASFRARICLQTSKPLNPGSMTSSTIKVGCCFSTASMALIERFR